MMRRTFGDAGNSLIRYNKRPQVHRLEPTRSGSPGFDGQQSWFVAIKGIVPHVATMACVSEYIVVACLVGQTLFVLSFREVQAALLGVHANFKSLSCVFRASGLDMCSIHRTTDLNQHYGLCASYPSVLIVPASVTDQEVEIVSQFRSEQRLPVLCWGRQSDSASIWRSSQPKVSFGS